MPQLPDAYRWLLGFVRPERRRLVVVLALSLMATGLSLLQPWLTKWLIDDGLLAQEFRTVVVCSMLLVATALLGALLGGFNRRFYVQLSGRVLFSLREDLHRHLQRLSPAFFARNRSGEVLTRLDGDVAEIQRFATDTLLAGFTSSLGLLGALLLMATLSWELSLLAFVLLPAQLLFLQRMRPRIERQTRTIRERTGALTAFLIDALGTMKLTQAVAAEGREARNFADLNRGYLRDLLRLETTSYVAGAVPGLLTQLATAIVFVTGGYWVVGGGMSVGTLIAFSVYMARATGPVQTLLGLYVAIRRARVSLDRVLELYAEAPAVTSPAKPRALPSNAAGELELRGVRFGYDDAAPLLDGVSAHFPAGAKIGLSGTSGVGKTTLIDLLARFYDPQAGTITLDGVDLRQLDLGDLRRRIAVVAQDTVLVPGSIADNIRYAVPEAGPAEIRDAASRAQLAVDIERMPNGYDTPVGNRGSALSGGQRQRLAIARALLQKPLVLILDEATSAVDRAAEIRIVQAVDRLFGDCTRIVISHRPEILHDVDRLYALEHDRLVALETLTERVA